MNKVLGLLGCMAAFLLPFSSFAANPSPPASSYGNMHTRCGYSDGGVLTTAILDCIANNALQQDGSGNTQQISSVRVGTRGYVSSYSGVSGTWMMHNAYTLDGTAFYPFDESNASFAVRIQTSGVTINYSPALNADGAITWTVIDTWNSSGSTDLNSAVTGLTVVPVSVTDVVAASTPGSISGASYNNGTAGVGATLTSSSNGAFPAQDGVTLTSGQRFLYKDAGSPQRNGIYTLTTVGNGSNPWVLTRATDADTAAELSGTFVNVAGGTTQTSAKFFMPLSPNEIIVGTTMLPFLRAN